MAKVDHFDSMRAWANAKEQVSADFCDDKVGIVSCDPRDVTGEKSGKGDQNSKVFGYEG